MKGIVFLSGLVSSLLTSVFILPALSQVTSDGTTNTTVSPNGNNFDILNGIQKGNNLFHSFKEFSIPTGSSATFNNSTDVENIINRVTGGNISNIDGLIKANGNANLFLINPSGIVFGENASLNIGGSFLGTTAESILFEDGFEFSAVNPQNQPLLTVSVPLGLQMGNNPGKIEVQGSGHQILFDLSTFSFIRDERPLGLQVPSGKTLALIGGDISLQGGNLTAEGGRVELGSVSESAKVELIPTSDGFTTGYENVNQFGDINLSQATSVEVSGEGGGNVQLQGRQISLLEESIIFGDTLGREDGGLSSVKASESVEIIGSNIPNFFTGFHNMVEPDATGSAGNITIDTPQLTVSGASLILTSTLGIGDAGDLNINTNKLDIQNGPQVTTATFAVGNGGDLTITATESVNITGTNDFPLSTRLFSTAFSDSTGDAGNLSIITSKLNLVEFGRLESQTFGSGNAGNMTLEVDNLAIRDGFQVLTGTLGGGNGADLALIAAESVEIDGFNNTFDILPTGLFSVAQEGSTGDAGNVSITTSQLSLTQNSRISVRTDGSGNAGNINLEVDNLTLRDGSQIAAGTFAGGDGGDLTLIAAESVEIDGFSDAFNTGPSGLFSGVQEGSTGNSGDVSITTPQLSLTQSGQISVNTAGGGNAGNITLKVDNLAVRDTSQIATATFAGGNGGDLTVIAAESVEIAGSINNNIVLTGLFSNTVGDSTDDAGNAGNMNITTPQLSLIQDSRISAATFGNGNAGDITLKVDNLVIRDGSRIATVSFAGGNGGDLTVTAAESVEIAGFSSDLIFSGLYSIADIESTGNAGNVNINTKQINVRDRGRISVGNFGSDNTGNLNVNADNIFLDNQASLQAFTNSGDQGNINLNSKFIQLRRNSNIATDASGTANGGNITINSPVIAGFENSDIIANAVQGNGGKIDITTQGLFGLKFRDQPTDDTSDITASSKSGIDGTVEINNVGIEPSSGLVELPELINTDVVIANSCVARSRKQDSTFYITGKAGFPYVPGEAVPSDYSMFEVRALSDDTSLKTSASPRKKGDSIVEATGIYPLENGELVIGRECES